jgi:hypothetical protein
MRKGLLLLIGLGMIVVNNCYAQEDGNLKKMTEDIIAIRKAKASDKILNETVIKWSASGKPKITLMDEIQRDKDNEYRGNGANKFKMNQMVTRVYGRQNTGMVSKGDYFNSTEKDVFYSAIEKSVKGKSKVEYTLTGHIGIQEFVFTAYNPNSKFGASVNGKAAKPIDGQKGILYIKLPKVKKGDKIVFSITNESSTNESYVILNHNPQK